MPVPMYNFVRSNGSRVVLALAALLVCATVASAQYGNGADRRRQQPRSVDVDAVVRPTYGSTDIDTIKRMVNLDEGQSVVVEALFGDFDDSFNAGVQQLRVALQQSQPGSLSGGTLEGVRNAKEQYDRQMRSLQESLSRDLRAANSAEERQQLRDQFTKAVERLTIEQEAVESRSGDGVSWQEFLVRQAELLQEWVERRALMERELLLEI
ncbi:MAG: hypothetical protein MK095_08835, partial [Phycisphaerales bacterium]|nr:hypothetical protein [Phycisphaerales bacterium]